MIENYSPSMDAHAKDDGGTLRKGVPWQTMVNCDGSYTLVRVFLSGGGATCTMLCSCQEIPLAVLARFCVRVCRLANQENLLSPSGREPDAAQGSARDAGRPKLLITPIFHDFFRFFPVFPWTFGRAGFLASRR